MPLLDHFHPPISERRSWEGFHGLWAACIVEKLNRDVLAAEFYADMQVHIGGQIEVDIATLAETPDMAPRPTTSATAVLEAPVWTPPTTTLSIPTVFPDDIEVQVFATAAGATLVAAIELVSPGNKDRPETRRMFTAKCLAYLSRGIGLVIVDIVTNRLANMHNELMAFLGQAEPLVMASAPFTYAVAYRPVRTPGGDRIDVWPMLLQVGQPLPELPLALRNAGVVPLDLEETYLAACQRSRLT